MFTIGCPERFYACLGVIVLQLSVVRLFSHSVRIVNSWSCNFCRRLLQSRFLLIRLYRRPSNLDSSRTICRVRSLADRCACIQVSLAVGQPKGDCMSGMLPTTQLNCDVWWQLYRRGRCPNVRRCWRLEAALGLGGLWVRGRSPHIGQSASFEKLCSSSLELQGPSCWTALRRIPERLGHVTDNEPATSYVSPSGIIASPPVCNDHN